LYFRPFLHVPDPIGQADAEHPTHGWPLDGKLDAQPPSQLLTLLSILRSFSNTDSSPAVVGRSVRDVPRDTVRVTALRVPARFCDLATGFGAWIVMPGRTVASEGGSVRDIAVALSPNVSSANDETATARLEKKRDGTPITISSEQGG
jgi:hypothetical protein